MIKIWMIAGISLMINFTHAQLNNQGGFTIHSYASISVHGDIVNTGDKYHHSNSNLILNGITKQTYTTSDTLHLHNISIANPNNIELDGIFEFDGKMTFIVGDVAKKNGATEANTQIIYMDGASNLTEPSNNSHISCKITKIGDDAFTFPSGGGAAYRPIYISSPADVNDAFSVTFVDNNPSNDGYSISSKDASINNINNKNYFLIDREVGNSNIELGVYIFWADWTTLGDPCDLVVVHWDGSQWENLGNGGTSYINGGYIIKAGTGDGNCGTAQTVNSFSPFNIGSTSASSILPIELTSFNGEAIGEQNHLYWTTASETNNDVFQIRRMDQDGFWQVIGEVDGAGNSNSEQHYTFVDNYPFIGENHYQIKQVDFNGDYSLSNIVILNQTISTISVFPNPSSDFFKLKSSETIDGVQVYDLNGRLIYQENNKDGIIQIDGQSWTDGVYWMDLYQDGVKISTEQILKRIY